jgi:hypothetical protein
MMAATGMTDCSPAVPDLVEEATRYDKLATN